MIDTDLHFVLVYTKSKLFNSSGFMLNRFSKTLLSLFISIHILLAYYLELILYGRTETYSFYKIVMTLFSRICFIKNLNLAKLKYFTIKTIYFSVVLTIHQQDVIIHLMDVQHLQLILAHLDPDQGAFF